MYYLVVFELPWCLTLNIERHKNLEVFVTACSNTSCVEYGVPLNVPTYIKNKFPNGIPCEKCKKVVVPKRSLASVKCQSCRRFKNYLDEHSFFKGLSNETDIVCHLCGGQEIDLKIFCDLKNPYEIEKEKIEEPEILKRVKTIIKPEPTTHHEENKRSVSNKFTTKSGISLAPLLPKKPQSHPETKNPKKKTNKISQTTPQEKQISSSNKNPTTVVKSKPPTTSTPNYPWREKRNSVGVIKPKDEFEYQHRKCATCGKTISMSTIQARPDTKYCIDHIEHAGRFVPVNDGIMSREGAKQMRGKDRSLAQQSKKIL